MSKALVFNKLLWCVLNEFSLAILNYLITFLMKRKSSFLFTIFHHLLLHIFFSLFLFYFLLWMNCEGLILVEAKAMKNCCIPLLYSINLHLLHFFTINFPFHNFFRAIIPSQQSLVPFSFLYFLLNFSNKFSMVIKFFRSYYLLVFNNHIASWNFSRKFD